MLITFIGGGNMASALISGLADPQLDEFDEKIAAVVYFENEEEANRELLDVHFLDKLPERLALSPALLAAIHQHNSGVPLSLSRPGRSGSTASRSSSWRCCSRRCFSPLSRRSSSATSSTSP